jgi:hypothetical protein
MITDYNQYYNALLKCIATKPTETLLVTYGMYAGIDQNGNDNSKNPTRPCRTRDVLEAMRKLPNVSILVSIAPYKGCKGFQYCKHCESKYVQQVMRLYNHAEQFKEFKWYLITECHLKCVIFKREGLIVGYAGGRNFTDSKWLDVSFGIQGEEARELYDYIQDDIMGKATPINSDTLNRVLESQQINSKTIEQMEAGIL